MAVISARAEESFQLPIEGDRSLPPPLCLCLTPARPIQSGKGAKYTYTCSFGKRSLSLLVACALF